MRFWNLRGVKIALGIFCAVAVLSVLVLSAKSDLWQIDTPFEASKILNPSEWKILNEQENQKIGRLVIERVLSKEDFICFTAHPSISFSSVNCSVLVFCDDVKIYSFANRGKRFAGNESGDSVHFFRIPEQHSDSYLLRIELQSFVKKSWRTPPIPKVSVGTMASLVFDHYERSSLHGILSLAMMGIGIMGLFFVAAFWVSLKKFPVEYFSLSIISLITGIGFLADCHFFDTAVQNSFLLYFIPTVILAFAPYIFKVYLSTGKNFAYNKKIFGTFATISIFATIFDCFCALVPIIPFSYARILTSAEVVLLVFFIVALQITESLSYFGSFSLSVILYLLSAISLALDLTLNIIPPETELVFAFSKPFFCAFFLVQSVIAIRDFFENHSLTVKKEMYEDAVSRDALTGTRTRPAFWKYRTIWKKKSEDERRKISVALCEILNLKDVNEKFGFEKGDELLKTLASVLQQNFQPEKIFRYDGSGFAIIAEKSDAQEFEKKISMIATRILDYNTESAAKIIANFGLGHAKFLSNVEKFDSLVRIAQLSLAQNRIDLENNII